MEEMQKPQGGAAPGKGPPPLREPLPGQAGAAEGVGVVPGEVHPPDAPAAHQGELPLVAVHQLRPLHRKAAPLQQRRMGLPGPPEQLRLGGNPDKALRRRHPGAV